VGEDTHRIEEEIRAERRELGKNLKTLEYQAKDFADWRRHYRRHAGAVLAVAFTTGALIGLKSRSAGARPMARPRPDASRPAQAGFSPLALIRDNPRARQAVGSKWDGILEALINVASATAVDWISHAIPGFREEYVATRR
jgi:hypothetical protein